MVQEYLSKQTERPTNGQSDGFYMALLSFVEVGWERGVRRLLRYTEIQ